ncbi:transposase [Geminicoccaceae bacterium 1502E]|nr:transposase [Geminicoccaceae bacterium 1502E]
MAPSSWPTDLPGRPLAFRLTPGDTADIRVAGELLAAAGPATRISADRGYDAAALRREIVERGAEPLIPGRRNRERPSATTPAPGASAGASRRRSTG